MDERKADIFNHLMEGYRVFLYKKHKKETSRHTFYHLQERDIHYFYHIRINQTDDKKESMKDYTTIEVRKDQLVLDDFEFQECTNELLPVKEFLDNMIGYIDDGYVISYGSPIQYLEVLESEETNG